MLNLANQENQGPVLKGWLTMKEAAFYIGKPVSWMYDNTHKLQIPHCRLERQYRFQTKELDSWLESRSMYKQEGSSPV